VLGVKNGTQSCAYLSSTIRSCSGSGLVGLLQDRGVEVVGQAGLAAEAVELACNLAPDVVLMDLDMPGMSGIEATARLRAAAPQRAVRGRLVEP
jgi:DNA-binding NarL/FixJ family response regulator